MNYLLTSEHAPIHANIKLSGSKSISNRLLIIDAIGNLNLRFKNLATAEDTRLMKSALDQIKENNNPIIDIHHAGTDMRFLTAFLSCKKGEWILTGSERMKQRPVGELVDALRKLGADIQYVEKEGFPPLKINGKQLEGGEININGGISSQFISALLLIAPTFINGLQLNIEGEMVSWPYIQMTIELLKQFGVKIDEAKNSFHIHHSSIQYPNQEYTVESDWSSASYWFSVVALAKEAEIILKHLFIPSLQADSVLPRIYDELGVQCEYTNEGLKLSKKPVTSTDFHYDYTECPDIAQTVAATCVGIGIPAYFTGLKTLKIKETDRISALKNELEKFGSTLNVTSETIQITPQTHPVKDLKIKTYHDHRMAMSIAPLSLIYKNIIIENAEVIEKSYPEYWLDLMRIGIKHENL